MEAVILRSLKVYVSLVTLVSILGYTNLDASGRQLGILNQPAPAWGVQQWEQLPEGKESLDVIDFKGKVFYLYCFQNWCPGCHSHGFPLLQKLTKHYQDSNSVAFVAIQTTFEGYFTNTFEGVQKIAHQYGLKIPVGQRGSEIQHSRLMRDYRTGGTPRSIVIDKQGVVRFNDFHIYEKDAIRLIDFLVKSR